jgi:cell division protein FtsW (lipid II flippase)
MNVSENYRTTQAVLVIIVFALFGLAGLNINWLVTVGSVLAAAAVALYASTTQPKPTHNDHGHHH